MADRPIIMPSDPLADAALTPEERTAWKKFRADYARLQEKVTQLQEKHDIAEDILDGMIVSRPEFNREVARLLALEERYGGTSSLVYFECGNLDALATQSSRSVVNTAIRSIGEALLRNVRGCDIVGRLDANEFGVLLARCNNEDAWKKGEILAKKMQEAVAGIQGHDFQLIINFGAYTFVGGDNVAHGIQAAAKAIVGKSS